MTIVIQFIIYIVIQFIIYIYVYLSYREYMCNSILIIQSFIYMYTKHGSYTIGDSKLALLSLFEALFFSL